MIMKKIFEQSFNYFLRAFPVILTIYFLFQIAGAII